MARGVVIGVLVVGVPPCQLVLNCWYPLGVAMAKCMAQWHGGTDVVIGVLFVGGAPCQLVLNCWYPLGCRHDKKHCTVARACIRWSCPLSANSVQSVPLDCHHAKMHGTMARWHKLAFRGIGTHQAGLHCCCCVVGYHDKVPARPK